MTESASDPAQILAAAIAGAAESHGGLQDGLNNHAHEVAEDLIAAIRAKTGPGAELRAALGVELTRSTRMGKNIQAAMDAYTRP